MKKLLLLITCAMSAGFIGAADAAAVVPPVAPVAAAAAVVAAPAAPAAPAKRPTLKQLGLAAGWVALGAGAYHLGKDVLGGLPSGALDMVATVAQVKGALYNLQQSLPQAVLQNPEATAAAVAVLFAGGTYYFAGWPKSTLGMAIAGSIAYAIAHWFLTHQMPNPNAATDASVVAPATTTTTSTSGN